MSEEVPVIINLYEGGKKVCGLKNMGRNLMLRQNSVMENIVPSARRWTLAV
jgi:hypothetical protein